MTQPFASATTPLAAAAAALALSACGGMPSSPGHNQATLPASIQVPAGHRVAMETVGVGEITYECRAKGDAPGGHAWMFVGPQADLNSRSGVKLGAYFGPPATWKANDGSHITGKQLAVAPGEKGSIPMQLVQANPAVGQGAMTGITYVQRVQTKGGVAPVVSCDSGQLGRKEIVKYQADYIFWKAA